MEKRAARIAACYAKAAGINQAEIEKHESELSRWEAEMAARGELLLDALESGQMEAGALTLRLAKLDEERERLRNWSGSRRRPSRSRPERTSARWVSDCGGRLKKAQRREPKASSGCSSGESPWPRAA
jgi:hypothetical protein